MGFRVEEIPITRAELEDQLHSFEKAYGKDSAQFVTAFSNGELNETDDFLDWANVYAAWELTA